MSRWRIGLVASLILLPFVAMAAIGTYTMWSNGVGLYLWFGMFLCMSTGYLLGWYWQRQRQLLRPPDFEPPLEWTERDRNAWALVEARAKAAPQVEPAKLLDANHYLDQAREMAQELATYYNPGAQDPVGALTIPEILTVVELASQDLHELIDTYIPGGHLLTINDMRLARKATDWYQSATNAYWVVAALFNPVQVGMRYAASKVGISQPLQMLQQNLLLWFYTTYLHRMGTYLVELNSGRLRVGAARYRELRRQMLPEAAPGDPSLAPAATPMASTPEPADSIRTLTITLMGQVKAGKSSVTNAILGERRAETDVLPLTSEVTRYQVQPAEIPTQLVLLDTVGYGHTGPREDQLRATQEAAQSSDLLILVLHARNPGRAADLQMLRSLRTWFASRPDLKMPRVLAVLTHVDLLSPAMEWSPPYHWENPQRPKEQSIAGAVAAVREQLGEYLAGVVPVCAGEGRIYGIDDYLMPAVAQLLDEARGVALLRVLRREFDATKARKLFDQLLRSGREVGKLVWHALTEPVTK